MTTMHRLKTLPTFFDAVGRDRRVAVGAVTAPHTPQTPRAVVAPPSRRPADPARLDVYRTIGLAVWLLVVAAAFAWQGRW